MILNTLRTYVKKFKATHGPEVIIACDNRHYWRREVYAHYKAGRKKARAATGHDWTSIFESLNKIKQELKDSSPYKVIDADGAEADDIIGALVQKYSSTQKIMILSSDKDFAQLQRFANVEQYSPIMKKYIKEPFPLVQLKQLIIRGDKGDGIPNILSPDDVFVTGGRQKAIREEKIVNWLNQEPKQFCDENMFRNFVRNETLIDLTKIPQNVCNEIFEQYENNKGKSKQEFMNYMMKNRLKNLLECIDEF